jgi:hypothetical protein
MLDRTYQHYLSDEANTPYAVRLLLNVGGGDPSHGPGGGIHWHMNIANEITYLSTDDQRQVIPYVRAKDREGHVTEYKVADFKMSPEEIERAPKRRMDCVDCHNRPSHIYQPPDRAVNEAMLAGRLDNSLPYLKRQAVEALSKNYGSTDEAVNAIATSLNDFYRTNYPEAYAGKREAINAAVAELQRIFQTYIFPEMKVDWQTHPDNIGHLYFQGCFRCHDGNHVSRDGKLIRNDCNICHTVLDQSEGGKPVAIKNGAFSHPLDIDVSNSKCTDCHTGKGIKQ